MSDSNSPNSWSAPTARQSGPSDAAPSVPPPPPEVKVRTMKSDLESMARSGGAAPQFQNVKAPAVSKDGGEGGGGKHIITIVAICVAVALFGAIAYFAYQVFFVQQPTQNSTNPPAAAPSPQPPSASPLPPGAGSFIHKSFFRTAADALLTLTIHTTAQSATDLATFNQRLIDLVSANKKGSFFEINVKDENGNDLGATNIMNAQDTVMIDPQYFSAHFLPDMTFFVYEDKNGLWPGYILSLQAKDNWLFVKSDVMKLEASPKLTNFFLTNPGVPIQGGFKDAIESGQPARILKFASPTASSTASSTFVYGLFHNFVVLSTSEDGLTQAIGKL